MPWLGVWSLYGPFSWELDLTILCTLPAQDVMWFCECPHTAWTSSLWSSVNSLRKRFALITSGTIKTWGLDKARTIMPNVGSDLFLHSSPTMGVKFWGTSVVQVALCSGSLIRLSYLKDLRLCWGKPEVEQIRKPGMTEGVQWRRDLSPSQVWEWLTAWILDDQTGKLP